MWESPVGHKPFGVLESIDIIVYIKFLLPVMTMSIDTKRPNNLSFRSSTSV